MRIHPTAIIDPSAQIADDVTIGPWTWIGQDVCIDRGCRIGSHVRIEHTSLGTGNTIASHAVLGTRPQHLLDKGHASRLIVGMNNQIFEYVVVHRGTDASQKQCTTIGHANILMNHSHVGHDASLANHVQMVPHAMIAGHVHVDDYAIIGGFSAVHQYCRIGSFAMLAHACIITQDVLPMAIVTGSPACVRGHNITGLKRQGYCAESIDRYQQVFRLIYTQGMSSQALIESLARHHTQDALIMAITKMIKTSQRGYVRRTSHTPHPA